MTGRRKRSKPMNLASWARWSRAHARHSPTSMVSSRHFRVHATRLTALSVLRQRAGVSRVCVETRAPRRPPARGRGALLSCAAMMRSNDALLGCAPIMCCYDALCAGLGWRCDWHSPALFRAEVTLDARVRHPACPLLHEGRVLPAAAFGSHSSTRRRSRRHHPHAAGAHNALSSDAAAVPALTSWLSALRTACTAPALAGGCTAGAIACCSADAEAAVRSRGWASPPACGSAPTPPPALGSNTPSASKSGSADAMFGA